MVIKKLVIPHIFQMNNKYKQQGLLILSTKTTFEARDFNFNTFFTAISSRKDQAKRQSIDATAETEKLGRQKKSG